MIQLIPSNSQILFIGSTNPGKIEEFTNFLSHFPLILKSQPKGIVVKETGKSFMDNARLKALEVAKKTNQWALADDSGLCVHALNGSPGIYSARYANSDEARIKRLLNELQDCDNRNADFVSAICIASPENGILLEVEAKCQGRIVHEPRGMHGFGYDPIFQEQSTGLTFAEMSKDQKREFGHRGRAFSCLEPKLKLLLS